jgi:hypothetical protein
MVRKNHHKHLHQLYRVLGSIKSDRLGKIRNKTKRRRVKLALGQVLAVTNMMVMYLINLNAGMKNKKFYFFNLSRNMVLTSIL